MGLVKRVWNFLFMNFMWLYIISALATLAGQFIPVLQIFMLICYIYGALQLVQIKNINFLDGIILIYSTYALVSSIGIDYPNHLHFLIHAFIFQVCPLMCYFIARNNEISLESVFKRMLVPMVIVMILGLYFYYAEPQWYTAIKWAIIYERYGNYASQNSIIEQMRLTSIFSSSYYIAFATFFFSTYLLYALNFRTLSTSQKFLYVVLLVICVLVIILANHRTTILGFMISYAYCFLKGTNKSTRKYMVLGGGVIAIIFIAIVFSSEEYMNYISARFQSVTTEEGYQERLEHTGGEQNLLSLFGDGYGRHSLRAREYGGWALIDSQYQKELGELGIVGFTMFMIILLVTGFKAINKRYDAGLELCIFLFFIEAFIGASCLAIDSEYSFIFWYVLGKINQKSINWRKKRNLSVPDKKNMALSAI